MHSKNISIRRLLLEIRILQGIASVRQTQPCRIRTKLLNGLP